MTCLESHIFGLNRALLLVLGIWPYEQSTFVRFQLIFLYGTLFSFIIFQFTAFATLKFTPKIVIEICSSAFFFIICIAKYTTFFFNVDLVKHLLDLLVDMYDELTDKSEIAIIEKYWIFARRMTALFTVLSLSSCLMPLFLPIIHNIVFLTNESQPFTLQIITEYFINKEKYSYLIKLHMNASWIIAVATILATGSINMVYVLNACGMFKIASYRIEQAMMEINLNVNNTKNINMVYMGIVDAVNIHCRAMHSLKVFTSTMNVCLAVLIGASVVSASLNLFRIFQEITTECDIKKLIWPMLFLSAIYLYMFVANFMSQNVMDHNDDIFVTVYNVKWYVAPLHIQRLILFLLQRGTKRVHVLIAGLFVGCLEGFATLMTASVSYFTFFYSTSQS